MAIFAQAKTEANLHRCCNVPCRIMAIIIISIIIIIMIILVVILDLIIPSVAAVVVVAVEPTVVATFTTQKPRHCQELSLHFQTEKEK